MASTEARNQNRTRPTKSNSARTKRQNDHRKRLVALGMDEATVAAMNPKEDRTTLKQHVKVAEECPAKDS